MPYDTVKYPRIALIGFAILAGFNGLGIAQNSVADLEFFGGSDAIITCKLSSDFKFLRKGKYRTKYQPATLTIYFNEKDSAVIDVKIKARAVTRRKICYFPPIKIKFKKDYFQGSSVGEFNKLKLVTHCKEQPAFTQRLIEEYLIYQAYQLLSNYSYRVRLLKINYIDTGSNSDPGWNYAFLIEDIDQLAQRNNSIEIETKNLHMEYTNRFISTLMPTFQYMIGNTDWSVPALHNIKLIKVNDPLAPNPIPIPYDFDYSGLVDAPYAIHSEHLNLENITDRLYRGFCRTEDEFHQVFKIFLEKKDEILSLFQENKLLDKQTIHNDIEYLEEFFSLIENEKAADRTILAECKKIQ